MVFFGKVLLEVDYNTFFFLQKDEISIYIINYLFQNENVGFTARVRSTETL
jgi:hypothetical protein